MKPELAHILINNVGEDIRAGLSTESGRFYPGILGNLVGLGGMCAIVTCKVSMHASIETCKVESAPLLFNSGYLSCHVPWL